MSGGVCQALTLRAASQSSQRGAQMWQCSCEPLAESCLPWASLGSSCASLAVLKCSEQSWSTIWDLQLRLL